MTPNSTIPTELNFNLLRGQLPYQYPYIMMDHVSIKDQQTAVGSKNVSMSDPCFQGHFPGNPVFPGVYLLETMVQTGGVLMHYNANAQNDRTLLLAVEKVKFRHPVFPGDRLEVEVKILRQRRRMAQMQASALVRGELAAQASFTLGMHHDPKSLLTTAYKTKPSDYPPVDAATKPIMTTQAIMNIIPHRPPFLLIDAVLAQDQTFITALKNITGNELFFGNNNTPPFVPGSLMLEAMAQTGAVHILGMPQYRGCIGYFMGLNDVRFRKPVQPGDQLVIRVELVANRPRVGRGAGQIWVGGNMVVQAGLSYAIVEPAQ